MKIQAIQYVALDVHQATLPVSVREGSGGWRDRVRLHQLKVACRRQVVSCRHSLLARENTNELYHPHLPMKPELIGYFAKRRTLKPPFLGAPNVIEICSVSPCIAAPPHGWIEHWIHNDWYVYNSPDEARRIAKDDPDQGDFAIYAYGLWPVAFAEDTQPLEIGVSPTALTEQFEHLGFDVVSRDMTPMFECSPLSCNSMASEVPANEYCLLSSLEEAEKFARRCAKEQPEPGTYFIVDVWRERSGA
jgi:hypothetical protein